MGRIHPTESKLDGGVESVTTNRPSVWTVWKKSSMAFQGTDGFSVYDGEGRLAFRVDNYSRKHKELLLMDGAGMALLALRPQILSLYDQWNAFKGEENTSRTKSKSHVFSVRRRSFLQKYDEADVFMATNTISTSSAMPDFHIEGCFRKRCCKIWCRSGEMAAEISRKKVSKSVVLGDDVFNLVISPGIDCTLIMAFVVVMDRICQKQYSYLICN